MTSWKRLAGAAVIAAGVPAAMLLVGVMACGPDFQPEVFVPAHQPESSKLYADGHLGVVQRGYFHAELVVAYRYLSGGRLSEAEKRSYSPAPEPPYDPKDFQVHNDAAQAALPTNRWLAARAAVQTPISALPLQQYKVTETQRQGYVERDDRLNCTDGAFHTAIDTLARRTKTWGANSEELQEWARGQDAVFSNCAKAGAMPDTAKHGWSTLLKQDRAYQIAAAEFYREDFDRARDDFVAIGKDTTSPWSRWGEYLAARSEVRKAAQTTKSADYSEAANFDKTGLAAAQTRLRKLQKETGDAEVRHAAAAELEFIEVRLDPKKRLDAASVALAGPQPDSEFAQDLIDLDFLMDRNVAGDSDLARWIGDVQPCCHPATAGVAGAGQSSNGLDVWREKRTVPWLVAAMIEGRGEDAVGADLLAAGSSVKPDSPAYATVSYSRIGMMLGAGKRLEARRLADTVIAGMGRETMASTRNAFLGERMQTARTLAEFLADAPRTVIERGSEAAEVLCGTWSRGDCKGKIPPKQFDADAATSMNKQIPLTVWEEAAESSVLPQNLRDAVAWAGWMRALGLGDEARVKRMSVLLPESVRRTAGDRAGFSATLALLRSPGMRPYLQQGVQRSATYGTMEDFRDNWWCGGWTDGGSTGAAVSEASGVEAQVRHAEFLTAGEKRQGADEAAKLNALPDGAVWLGRRAIAYVKAHPEDKDAAEALGLAVRATHLGCSGKPDGEKDKSGVSKQAFEMLHRMYPQSEWAAKTKYYY